MSIGPSMASLAMMGMRAPWMTNVKAADAMQAHRSSVLIRNIATQAPVSARRGAGSSAEMANSNLLKDVTTAIPYRVTAVRQNVK